MRKVIETRIPYMSMMGVKVNRIDEWQEHLESLIRNRTIIHNDLLNIDYIVLGLSVSEEVFSHDQKVRLTIDILDEIDIGIQHQLNTFRKSIGHLLNTSNLNLYESEVGEKE